MLPVLKFRPVLMPKPWGGDGLWRFLKKGAPEDDRMGESWELSDRPEGETLVEGGPLDGARLADLLRREPVALVGADQPPGGRFPLLYKFIWAREKLSVQVHPGEDSPLGEAKTECWYIVDAEPGAEIIVGVRGGATLERLESPECEQVLQRLPARRGDVFHIPAGTVHAITEGLLLYELQQNSDTTFRLYDWGRVDAAGKPRKLHLTEAGQVADLEPRAGYKIPPLRVEHASHREDFLVACPFFVLKKWTGFKGPVALATQGRFLVLSVVAGEAAVRDGGSSLSLRLGDTALVPACIESVRVEAGADAEILVSFIPDLDRDVRAPLRAVGHGTAAIEKLFGPAPQ
jgi:mannose-6-phosphate isomerase